MKRMASPTSWFGLRTKSSSKRSVSPVPFTNASLSLRASMRSRSQPAEDSGPPARELIHTARAEARPFEASTEDALRPNREELMRTYLSWVNAHLKKRKESDKVTDLAAALRDGVTLLNLAEALSGREVSGVARMPDSEEERETNVSRVLSFLMEEGLEVRFVSCREIMQGNMKHLLKVIYAMACHYKAAPIPRTTSSIGDSSNYGSAAVSEYASLMRQVNEFEKKLRGNALIDKYRRMSINSNILSDVETGAGGYDTDDTVCDSPVVSIPKSNHSDKMEEPIYINMPLCQSGTADFASILRHAGSPFDSSLQDVINKEIGAKNRELHVYSEDSTDQIVTVSPLVKKDTVETCLDELSTSLDDLTPIKQQIIEVQNALGRSTLPTDPTPEVSALRSQLSESERQRERLSLELSGVVQECTDLSNRLTESLSIRADVLRKDYLLQNSESENLFLRIAAREKDEVIKQLNGSLLLRQELVDTLESQLSELNRDKERRGRVSGSGSHPTLCNLSEPSDAHGHLSTKVKEVCDVMFSLRARVSKDPPSIQLIDSIENGLYAIVERLYYYAARTLKRPKSDSRGAQSPRNRDRGSGCNRAINSYKPECTDLDPSELVVFDICQSPLTPETPTPRFHTQVLYYVNKQETPCRVGIQKQASDVKLSDVKCQINRGGGFSYHFKVEDPDFGALKEEISLDTDPVPIYKKNTIVAYLESHDV